MDVHKLVKPFNELIKQLSVCRIFCFTNLAKSTHPTVLATHDISARFILQLNIVLAKPLTMNEFLNKYVDITALLITLILPLILTIQFRKKAQSKLRAVPAYFLLFGPSGVITFIFFHLFENSYHAIERSIAGSFKYDFRFYSLMLLGFIVAYSAYLFYKSCRSRCLEGGKARPCLQIILFVLMVSVPLVPITPIAMAPIIWCTVSLLALPLVHKKVRVASIVIKEDIILLTA